ncbi:hypothetical protein [Roseicitreum antarcticum]|uniref:Uncharacterized protein n=1 Tax=Roseicitreum antarcticum TaxID=564137 RepID=A0A1H3E6A6_9RHOB|nr:hypothetical protein [Roseicitreum antarcticum]SDX74211.1 hypothetical protein SAMN04488238_11826 [Roseicitreum antarcticum]
MSFFAGFVNGVFQGKDWREARNDRERARKIQDEQLEWDREDREWTGEARGRQREVWSQADEDRARQQREQARLDAESAAEREAFGQTADQMAGRNPRDEGISIAGVASSNEEQPRVQAQPARRGAIPPTEDRALGVMGFSEQPGPGGAIMQDRLAGQVAQRETARNTPPSVPDQVNSSPEPVPARTIAAVTPGAAVAPDVQRGADITGIAPYVPGQDRAAAPAAPAPSQSRPVPQNGNAMQDARQGRGQGYSDYTEATRGVRSDAPRRVDAPPAAPASEEAQARAQRIAGVVPRAAGAVTNVAKGAMADFAAFGGDMRAAGREGLGVINALTGNEAGAAASFDTARDLRSMGDQRQQDRAAQQTPRPQTPAAPGQAMAVQTQPTGPGPRRAAPNVSAAQPAVVSGASEGLPRTEEGTPMGSVQAATTVAQRAGMSVASAARGDASPAQSRQVADRAADATVREYRSTQMPPIVEHYIRTGQIEKARAFEAWTQERSVQQGMRSWARAMHAFSLNDMEGMLDGLVGAYEAQDYYDDGLSVVREGTQMKTDPQSGEVIGATIMFRDNQTGRTFRQEVNGLRDMVAIGVGALAPEAAFDRMWSATFGADEDNRPERLTAQNRIAIRKQAAEEAGIGATPEQITAAEQRILGSLGQGSGGGQVPLLAD